MGCSALMIVSHKNRELIDMPMLMFLLQMLIRVIGVIGCLLILQCVIAVFPDHTNSLFCFF